MEIKPKKSLTFEEIKEIERKKQEFENSLKQEANRKFLGNLRSKNQPTQNKENRFHLPVLHINDPTQWPSQPLENRLRFTDEVAYKTCLGNCCGVEGLKSACCQMDPEDMEHVLGPVDEDWIKDIVRWLNLKGISATRSDIVIDYEEGKIIGEKFFNGERKAVFQAKETYPILRFQVQGPRYACKFLNPNTGKCNIYEKRPNMCRGYYCQYINANFLVRTNKKDHPNTYVKIR